jgi:regulator of replication initiation timing
MTTQMRCLILELSRTISYIGIILSKEIVPLYLSQHLDQYGNLINVLDQVAAEVESLRSEFSSLLTKVNELRGEEGRISHRLKYQLEEQNRAVQRFLKDVDDKISESKKASDQALQSIKTESLLAVEQARKKE